MALAPERENLSVVSNQPLDPQLGDAFLFPDESYQPGQTRIVFISLLFSWRHRIYKQLAEAEKKIQRLEERYINEEIDRELFLRYKEKFINERREIEAKLVQSDDRVSNLENLVENVLHYTTKLTSLWDLGEYQESKGYNFWYFRKE